MEAKVEQTPATNANPVLSVDKNGTVLYSNEAGELLLHEWGVRVGEKVPSRIGDIVQRVISHYSPEKIELKVGNKVFLVIFSPLPEQECVNISGFDISDQKELEVKLRESEEDLAEIQKTAHIGSWKWNIVTNELRWSDEVYRIFGLNPQEFEATFDAYFNYVHPDDRDYLNNAIKKAFEGEPYSIDNRIITANGEERIVHTDAIFTFNENNVPVYARGIVQDITERKQAERALRESEERFRSAFDDSAVAMALVCPDARLLKVNDAFCRLLGFEKSEMESSTFLDFTYPDDIKPSMLNHKAVINREKPFFWLEKRYICKDGRVIWCEVSSSPVFDSKDCPIYTVAHVQDITERKEAEEALRLSNLYNRSLIEASLDPLVTIGRDGKVTDVNTATEQVTGYSRDNLIGTDFSDYFTEPEKARVGYQKVFTYGKVWDYPLEIRHKDGHTTHVLYNASLYRNENGEVRGIFAAARDITERKKAEYKLKEIHENLERFVGERTAELEKAYSSLKESEEGLEEAQKMAHIGNWDWNLITGEVFWSNELYRIFGRNPQESGASLDNLLNYVHPDDRNYVDNSIKKGLKREPFGIDYRIILADGEERIVYAQSKIIFDEENIPIRVKGIIQDITKRKEAEEKLRESEEKYRNIVETANEGIGLIDNELKLTYVNKKIEDMIGYSSAEIIGKTMWDFISDESKPIVKSILERGLQDFENPELKYIRKDDSHLWAQVNAKPIFDSDGKFMGIMTMLTDITKRKEAEETLNKIDIARKQEIHHRIKNNLQVISSLLDLQAEKFNNKKNIKYSEVLEAFRESQDRVISMALIHEELHKGGEIDTLNFSSYIKELADNLFLTYGLGNEGISLNMDIEEDIFFDMDTAVPLGIIINELVSNSLKHAFTGKDNGEIRIKLHREECKSTTFTMSVSDNGIGFPENLDIEDLDSLGLQLVTTLVEQLDGELELKRDNGTEFIIRFAITGNNDQELMSGNVVNNE